MKCKLTTGGGMAGLLKYQNKSDSEFISGSQPDQASFLRETAAIRSLRPDCKKPVLHVSLSPPPQREAGRRAMGKSGRSLPRKNGVGGKFFFLRSPRRHEKRSRPYCLKHVGLKREPVEFSKFCEASNARLRGTGVRVPPAKNPLTPGLPERGGQPPPNCQGRLNE